MIPIPSMPIVSVMTSRFFFWATPGLAQLRANPVT
jgi:hypothetical protein